MTMGTVLSVQKLNGYYGKSHVLNDVSFAMNEGEIVGLLGRNGVGKTTLMRAVAGVLTEVSGQVMFQGQSTLGLPAHSIARLGMSLVPEDRSIFTSLTVEENLVIGRRPGSLFDLARIWEMFPSLERRRRTAGGMLSGGEQQMLAIGRALMTHPKLLLLDEPTEGLAPVIVDRLVEIIRGLKAMGISVLLVEQNFDVCLAVADRILILESGAVAWRGTKQELAANAPELKGRYLSLEHA